MTEALERAKQFGEMLKSIHSAYMTILTPEFELIYSSAEHKEIMFNFMRLGIEEAEIEQIADNLGSDKKQNPAKPTVFTNSLGMVWFSENLVVDGVAQAIVMLGPVFMDDISVQHIGKELDRLQLSVSVKHVFVEYIQTLPIVSLRRLYDYGAMLHFCLTGESANVSDFWYPQMESAKEVDDFFQPKHGTYVAEQEILRMVEEGNLDYKKVFDKYSNIGEMGLLSNGEVLRQEKNTVIMFTVLCSRAAIRGGLASETALTLCDDYIRRVENMVELSTLTTLSREMLKDFVTRVYRIKTKESNVSPQIRKACDYIRMYPEANCDIHYLAEMTGYSDYYFSSKFKQETGKSVRDFSMESKVDKAKQLLLETNQSVSEIADFLGFGTQSYFGEVFRKQTGTSPSKYRESGGE